jgi:hypothetical protein
VSTSRLFSDDDFQYGLELAVGASYRQAADVGEVLVAASRIVDRDADSWMREWTRLAGSMWACAVAAERGGHRVTALAHYRRAATYYATALYRSEHSSTPADGFAVWQQQRRCWERIVDLYRPAGERISIPYEDTVDCCPGNGGRW